jgi:hypothetical protein
LLYDQWVIEVIREKMKKFLEFTENESTTFPELMGYSKGVIRRKFIAMNA